MLLDNRKPMSNTCNFLIVLVPFVIVCVNLAVAVGEVNEGGREGVRLNLMHRHHPKIVERLENDMNAEDMKDRVRDIHAHDSSRHRTISALLDRKLVETKVQGLTATVLPPPLATGIGLKMYSGADYGSSEYFVELKVGTPPQNHVLIADTGSDLTWVKCRYRRCIGANCSNGSAIHKSRNERKEKLGHVFYANHSSSFIAIPCGSNECGEFSNLFVLRECKAPTNPCRYDYSYAGGASARGLFAVETLTVNLTDGTEKQLKDTLIGCTESVTGDIFNGSDGVIGLGAHLFSFTHKAAQSSHGGGFSYCLVDHLSDRIATSYFVLGSPSPATLAATSTAAATGTTTVTKLLLGEEFHGLYGVPLTGISVDGVTLNIPPRVWDAVSGGGTIIDSGTSLTFLTMPAYEMVLEAFVPKFSKFERIKLEPFEFCFNNTLYDSSMAPKLRFHFSDGAVFEPPAKSYVIPVLHDIGCFGFVPAPFPATNILGNILQQNHLWQFDFFKHTIAFTPSECI